MGRRDNIIAFQRPVSARKGPRLPWERRFHISRRLRQFGILSAALLAIPVALLQVEKPFAERPTIASVSDIGSARVTVSWVANAGGRLMRSMQCVPSQRASGPSFGALMGSTSTDVN